MKKEQRKNIVGLSLVTAVLLGSSAYAGKIITNADVTAINVVENTQFGFGGWNFDNVNVRIVHIDNFGEALEGTYFDTGDGTYTPMGVDQSFESEIKSATGEVMGHLHGKDWPVGEPAGIKIINDDLGVSHGKPYNCIMTSSYLVEGYLDTTDPQPVLCSSGWQSHKRYKINLLPSTVANIDGVVAVEGYGEPVDLVFNLDPLDGDIEARRYQVLQKVNNYTGKRLKGYKVEVLNAAGDKIPELTLSLGLLENDGADIWDENELANYSHGLWGPYQRVGGVVRFENGFFDYKRSYYAPALEDAQTISYVGDMLGGNYQEIFGNWLPSIWAPMGIFHDDDMDPATDGILKAFLGVAPGETTVAWWKSTVLDVSPDDQIDPVYSWVAATQDELDEWELDVWHEEDHVEDVLNLGLNYIINVGENAKIGSTFILRVTPYVDSDQTVPRYMTEGITPPNVAPTADAGDDQIVQVGMPITITGLGTDSDEDDILSYVWSEGDVELATTASFVYKSDTLGRHTLTLTVTDGDATGTDTMIVKVRPNAPQPQNDGPQGPKN